jgi:hypothetical protein
MKDKYSIYLKHGLNSLDILREWNTVDYFFPECLPPDGGGIMYSFFYPCNGWFLIPKK